MTTDAATTKPVIADGLTTGGAGIVATGADGSADGCADGHADGCAQSAAAHVAAATAAPTEQALIRALAWFRVGGLAQMAIVIALNVPHYPLPVHVMLLAALVAAESIVLITVYMERQRMPAGWILADVLFCGAGLAIGTILTPPSYDHASAEFMYPFTVITSFGIGVAFRRTAIAVVVTMLLMISYLGSAIAFHEHPLWQVVPSALSYPANTFVAWTIAWQLRRSGRAADRSRAEAIAHAAELAQERERLWHARFLHDHALQTMEILAHGQWITDAAFRAHVAAEAARMRAVVQGIRPDDPRDLPAELHSLVLGKARSGLRVEFNGTHLNESDRWRTLLAPGAAAALLEATSEVLTNVAKHAGVTTASMHACVEEDKLTVSVLDHGSGFNLADTRGGVGLDICVRRRMADVGGQARIESAPGQGTYVELTVPLSGSLTAPPTNLDLNHDHDHAIVRGPLDDTLDCTLRS